MKAKARRVIKTYEGDCLSVLKKFPDSYFSTVITDPPYGLSFMAKDWDHGVPGVRFWKEFLRVCKPGAIALVFGGTRTHHRLMCAIEDAGWEIRDCMMWIYGSGFPKSLDISKAIDKAKGARREIIGKHPNPAGNKAGGNSLNMSAVGMPENADVTAPATGLAKLWDGYGTALKPAWEPIIVAMKPCEGTFAANAEKHGVAGLWIDGGRIETNGRKMRGGRGVNKGTTGWQPSANYDEHQGRWPANVILDEQAGAMLDEQSGVTGAHGGNNCGYDWTRQGINMGKKIVKSSGGASRFFYCAKASKKERNIGLDGDGQIVDDGRKKKIDNPYLRGKTLRQNTHPTVKPLALIEYLCKLTKSPTGGIVLDPFAGSGTTGLACQNVGRSCILIEKKPEYCEIMRKRLERVSQ